MFGMENGTAAATAAAETISNEAAAPASPTRAEANRRNALKSTGPRTAEGKERSRFNALKHGMRARRDVLPGEDAEEFRGRVDAWTADLGPSGEVERHLIERAARSSWQLDRADRAEIARLSRIIQGASDEADRQEEEDALAWGRRLLWDRRGPLALYPRTSLREGLLPEREPRTSFSGTIDDPDDPARLLVRLESTAAGCRWLLARWAELENLLETGRCWQAPDRFKAVRLLGHQPIDAADSTVVLEIYLSAWVLSPERLDMDAFTDLWKDMLPGEEARFKVRLIDRRSEELLPRDRDAARERLGRTVRAAADRLAALLKDHLARAEADRASRAEEQSFDASDTGERLRRHQIACNRSMLRTLDVLRKLRNGKAAEADRASAKPDTATARPADKAAPVDLGSGPNTALEGEQPHLANGEFQTASEGGQSHFANAKLGQSPAVWKGAEGEESPAILNADARKPVRRRSAPIENRTNEAKANARSSPRARARPGGPGTNAGAGPGVVSGAAQGVSSGPPVPLASRAGRAGKCVQSSTCVKLEGETGSARPSRSRRARPWS